MSKCKECGLPIQWRNEGGQWQCYDAGANTVHWDLCSAEKFARIQRTGKFFDHGDTKGYVTPLRKSGVQFTQQSSGIIAGRHKIVPCNECVPPWKVCDFGCPNEIIVDKQKQA